MIDEITKSELEKEELDQQIEERLYEVLGVRFSRDTIDAIVNDINKVPVKEEEISKDTESYEPMKLAYHTEIQLGKDAEIKINGDDISIIISAPNGKDHILTIDRASLEFILRHIDSPYLKESVIDNTGRQGLVVSRGSTWSCEMVASNEQLDNMLIPELRGKGFR